MRLKPLLKKSFRTLKSSSNGALFTLGLVNLIYRVWFSFHSAFGSDEKIIFSTGYEYFTTGNLPAAGAVVIYTGKQVPGSLESLLLGLPLWISGGHPWGSAVFLAILHFFAMLITFALYRKLFPRLPRAPLFLFIMFAPWGVVFTSVWNPSFLPFFSAIFFWCVSRLMRKPKHFWASAGIPFSILMCLQLHLSFVLLVGIFVGLLATRVIRFPNAKGLGVGVLMGMSTLWAYVGEMIAGRVTGGSYVGSHVQIALHNIQDFPKFFLRFLTFPTGETTRFFSKALGIQGIKEFFSNHLSLVPLFWVGIFCSTVIVFWGLRFYFQKTYVVRFREQANLTMFSRFALMVWWIPFLTGASFLFSMKEPSAHTYWILFPISFFPALYSLRAAKVREVFRSTWGWVGLIVFLAATNLYTVIGYRESFAPIPSISEPYRH